MTTLPASRLQLPPGPWQTLIDGLCARFPAIPRAMWLDRFARDRVLDAAGQALHPDAQYRVGLEIRYFREVADEAPIAAVEHILHEDAHLLVVDKPHGLPVVPSGAYVRETLLARLIERTGNPQLVPLHRLDRDTAGLVLFSVDPATRNAYQALFRDRRIEKTYAAIAPSLPSATFPHVRRSCLARGEPFFRTQEVAGEPNSETHVDVVERGEAVWRYTLTPITGRKHQLRVHMAALGAPILGDVLYPQIRETAATATAPALALLAQTLRFIDPLSGDPREFRSGLSLDHPDVGRT